MSREWKKNLHYEELNYLYSPNIVRMIKSRSMRWVGRVARMDERRGVYRVLVGKPEGKKPLGRARSRWEDNIKMAVQEVGWGRGTGWLVLDQDRVVAGPCTCGKEPSGLIKFEELFD